MLQHWWLIGLDLQPLADSDISLPSAVAWQQDWRGEQRTKLSGWHIYYFLAALSKQEVNSLKHTETVKVRSQNFIHILSLIWNLCVGGLQRQNKILSFCACTMPYHNIDCALKSSSVFGVKRNAYILKNILKTKDVFLRCCLTEGNHQKKYKKNRNTQAPFDFEQHSTLLLVAVFLFFVKGMWALLTIKSLISLSLMESWSISGSVCSNRMILSSAVYSQFIFNLRISE